MKQHPPGTAALVSPIIGMAEGLGLNLIAAGVLSFSHSLPFASGEHQSDILHHCSHFRIQGRTFYI